MKTHRLSGRCALRKIFYLFLVFFFISANYTQAQMLKDASFSMGLATLTILGDNLNTKPFNRFDTLEPLFVGGGYNGSQLGFAVKADFPLDKDKIFTIPVGIEYYFLQGLERVPLAPGAIQETENSNPFAIISIGFNYALFRYPPANAKIYTGIDIRSSIIPSGVFTVRDVYRDSVHTDRYTFKSSAFRVGGSLFIGLEGEIGPHWFVNASGNLGILNLIGRDDSRGELFSPKKDYKFYTEKKESLVATFNLFFLVQYRI